MAASSLTELANTSGRRPLVRSAPHCSTIRRATSPAGPSSSFRSTAFCSTNIARGLWPTGRDPRTES